MKLMNWIQKNTDKFAHFGISCFLILLFYAIFKEMGHAVTWTFSIGLIKEMKDGYDGHFSWGDMLANVSGIYMAILLISLIPAKLTWY